jgi:hypothetical protein
MRAGAVGLEAPVRGERGLLDELGQVLVEEDTRDEFLARPDFKLLEEALHVIAHGVG